jgi:7-carboxy-7-deazaguanine synthase
MSAPTLARPPRAVAWPVIEIFGPVIQGEGAMIGRQTHFVRFGGCDYHCAWCDSLYAVEPALVRANSLRMDADAIVSQLQSLNPGTPWVTLSGGNPALHALDTLVDGLHAASYRVAVETQGTRYRPWLARTDLVTISPKPPSSGMTTDWTQLERFLTLPDASLKVVVFDEADFAYAREVHRRYSAVPFYLQVGNSVGIDTTEALLARLDWLANRALADPAMTQAIVLPQLHVLLYGNRRGV